MPYSKAHYFLISILVISFFAFWDSYFSRLTDAPLAHHLHGITASTWILLMAVQSWLIHHQKVGAHRSVGLMVFILVPVMSAAFGGVILAGSIKTAAQHPFYMEVGKSLLTADVLLLFTTALQVYLALKFRRKIRLHSAFMFGTLIGLLPPILSRLTSKYIPGLKIEGIDTLYKFEYSLQVTVVFSVLIALFLYNRYRKDGWPWLLAAGIAAMMYVLHATLGQTEMWHHAVHVMAETSAWVFYGTGFLVGLAACGFGWVAGKRQ